MVPHMAARCYSRRPQHSLVLNIQRGTRCLCLGTWIAPSLSAPQQSSRQATTSPSLTHQTDALSSRQGRKRGTFSFFSAVKSLQFNLWILTFRVGTKQSSSKSKYFLQDRVCFLQILAKCCIGSLWNSIFCVVPLNHKLLRDMKTYLPTIRQ